MNAEDALPAIHRAAREIADGYPADGLRITLAPVVSFSSNGSKFGLRIERERETASGRQGKPVPIVLLINNPGESPADMLRTLAAVFEQEPTS